MAERIRCEVAQDGQAAVVRRALDCGTELERLALLTRLGHCAHTFLLLVALESGEANELLAWWREAAPLLLRGLLGEPVPAPQPFVFQPPEFSAVTSEREALQTFERFRTAAGCVAMLGC